MKLTHDAELRTTLASGLEPQSTQTRPNHYAVLSASRFIQKRWLKLATISAIVLVPCWWHGHIVASDLGSHLYNAWLAQLVRHGQAPGLWLARQWTNVLFDLLLSGFGSVFGFPIAEKIAVSLAVLIFFWGLFALMCAAARRAPWFLLPCIALVTYGWTFHMGFFNYYLSIGLSFWGLAIFWRGEAWERLIAIPIALLVAFAHPFGLIWLLGGCFYLGLAEALPRRYQFALFLTAAVAIVGIHYYFWRHYIVEAEPGPLYWFIGADQLVLFGAKYRIPELTLVIFAIVALAADAIRRRYERGAWGAYSLPLQIYGITELGVFLFPRGVHFPHHVAIALITERLTIISAAAGCCLLGVMRPSKWHLAGSLAVAAIFFSFVYQDTGAINKMERQAEKLVHTLPPDQRVMGTILPLRGSRILIQHMIDRACIEHCFSYGNYEPGSGVFRVRAAPHNPYVLDSYQLAVDTEQGTYLVQPEDLPVYQIYQCSSTGRDLCISSLRSGERNNHLGIYRGQ